jgi:hypothetical protein
MLHQSLNSGQGINDSSIALAGIVRDLPARLVAAGISAEVTNILMSSVQQDAERLRLSLRERWSRESVCVERESHRQAYAQSPFGYRLFHLAVLGLAGVLPPETFCKLRSWYAERGLTLVRQVVGSATPVPSLSLGKTKDS